MAKQYRKIKQQEPNKKKLILLFFSLRKVSHFTIIILNAKQTKKIETKLFYRNSEDHQIIECAQIYILIQKNILKQGRKKKITMTFPFQNNFKYLKTAKKNK